MYNNKIIIIIIIGWGLESRPVFATLADRISGRTGQAKSRVVNQLYQRLAITLTRQHACAKKNLNMNLYKVFCMYLVFLIIIKNNNCLE